MQDVPKIVQARLQRTTPQAAEGHPDADLLTAFAEQSLGESERAGVMQHLARCGDCREVVGLALPATEAVTMPSSTRHAAVPWLRWPVLRWSVVAAGIALVTSVGILQYRQRIQQNAAVVARFPLQEEKVTTQPRQPAALAGQAIVPRTSEIAKQTPMRQFSRTQRATSADQPSPSPNVIFAAPQSMTAVGAANGGGGASRANSVASGAGEPSKNNQEQVPGNTLALAPTASQESTHPAAAAPRPQVVVSGASAKEELQSESARVATQDQVSGEIAENQAQLPPQSKSSNLDVVKAKDSVPPQGESGVSFALTAPAPDLTLQKTMHSEPRWAISSSGALQRSFDSGATWEDVNVNRTPLARGLRMEGASESKDGYKLEKSKKSEEPASNPVIVFRAVAALGTEVWAGGSDRMLYHSLDLGNHWTRVVPAEANTSLSGDINGVEFSDIQHGKVATSAGEVWLTSNSGQTWHKQ
ncbi:MAG: hypothetical protein JWQ87_3370 [Candidatus Sulfotelmatobacter sp.]|nr:hypothetical protein [Candidatus Sulfotelmatobacter sp.]